MALNPEIALGVRPPVLQPLEIQSPLERYGKVLTLRGMMEQQQLRGLQMQQAQLNLEQDRQGSEQDRAMRELLVRNPNASQQELIGAGGLDRATKWQTAQAAAQKAELDRAASEHTVRMNQAKLRAQIAAGVKDEDSARKAVWTAYNAKAYDLDPIKNAQAARELWAHLAKNGFNQDEWTGYAQESLDYVAREELKRQQEEAARKAERAPYELRKTIADTQTAEQTATGTQPITLQQRSQAEAQLWGDPGGLIAIINDPNRSPADKQRAQRGLRSHEELKRAGAATTSLVTPNQNIGNEAKLRDDYRQDTKTYVIIRDAYNKIVSAAKSQSAAGDLALVYGFMKLQDPGSTVREGERADAANAGGVPERVRALWNKMLTGEQLDPKVRADFVAQAQQTYGQSHADYLKTKDMYTGIASRGGMDPRNVVIDYSAASPATVILKDGSTATFPSGAAAEAFKKDNPGLVR